jgi:hypothetical protein
MDQQAWQSAKKGTSDSAQTPSAGRGSVVQRCDGRSGREGEERAAPATHNRYHLDLVPARKMLDEIERRSDRAAHAVGVHQENAYLPAVAARRSGSASAKKRSRRPDGDSVKRDRRRPEQAPPEAHRPAKTEVCCRRLEAPLGAMRLRRDFGDSSFRHTG